VATTVVVSVRRGMYERAEACRVMLAFDITIKAITSYFRIFRVPNNIAVKV